MRLTLHQGVEDARALQSDTRQLFQWLDGLQRPSSIHPLQIGNDSGIKQVQRSPHCGRFTELATLSFLRMLELSKRPTTIEFSKGDDGDFCFSARADDELLTHDDINCAVRDLGGATKKICDQSVSTGFSARFRWVDHNQQIQLITVVGILGRE
eukprot:SAG11_NODE_8458_length_1013_cov_0.982495_1_plen_153_part_10